MTTPILTTKLYIPPLPSNLVARARLIEKLTQGLNKKLTLISAPAGFGKTTLLCECVINCGFPAAWYSLDEGDDNLERFLAYFIAALQTTNNNIDIGIVNSPSATQSAVVEPVLTEVINQIAKSSAQSILVLDDYHVIESVEVDQAVWFFLANMPPQMHLVIATRTDPILPLPRLRSKGQLTEIRVDDLRFSTEEAANFLEKRMGLNVSTKHIATLESRTEGWITGLQLAAISMQRFQDQHEIACFIENFSSSNRYILDYLTDEVLSQRPSGTKDFLLKTSILDRLCDSLCNAVTGTANCQETLESLEAANLFVVPLDDQRGWYRYHHLFKDLLQIRLQRTSPSLISELHRLASSWYADNDLIDQAISHSLAAEDFDQAAQLTEKAFFERMSRGEDFAAMMARLVILPDNIILARPSLGIMYAWMLSLTLQLDQVEPRLADIEDRFGDQLPAALQRQIAAIRAEVYRNQAEFEKSIEDCLHILERLPEELTVADQQTYTGVVSDLAWGYVLMGEMDQAQKWFAESLVISRHSITLTLIGLYGLSLVEELQGNLQQAIDICFQGLDLIEGTPQKIQDEVHAAVYTHLRLGNLLRERNQLEEAERHLRRGLELGNKWRTVGDTLRDGYIDLAKLKLAQRDFQGAAGALKQAEALLSHYHSVPNFGYMIAVQKARTLLARALSRGDRDGFDEVEKWADEQDFSVDGLVRSINEEYAYMVWIRYLIAQNQPEKALKVLEGLIASAGEAGRTGRVIEMRILQCLAYRACGDHSKALDELKEVLSQAESEGYVRVFVDEGPPMKKLLRQAAAQGFATKYVKRLLDAFKTQEVVLQSGLPTHQQSSNLVEPLSERELEVMHLLAEGATNQEIAGELVIAVTTAKKHVSNIIGKLGVSNRTQAVSRARELKLI